MKPVDAPEGSVWEYEYGNIIFVMLHEPFFGYKFDGKVDTALRRWCYVLSGSALQGLVTISEHSGWNNNSERIA